VSAALVCRDPGLLTTVQDRGRFGLRHLGLSGSGAMDPGALRLANCLVGNDPWAAAIEMALKGGRFEVDATSVRIAIAGAEFTMTADGEPLAPWRSHRLERGQVLTIGTAKDGVWGYLAVAGGLDLPLALGSRSTHLRAEVGGLHGRRLEPGDRLPLLCSEAEPGPELGGKPQESDGSGPFRVIPGPQDEAFSEAGLATFLDAEFAIGPMIDRMGYRLEGPRIEHADGFNIVSDAVVPGSVQVPGYGQPIVMMADHQTTGGYPKIATVITADLPRLAQLRPGAPLRFLAVDLAEADRARRLALQRRRKAEEAIAPLRPTVGGARPLDPERLLSLNLVGGVIDANAPEAH
jgi:5-oxoprolinase (ATP-hydrolysing) subunit C